MEVVLMSRRPVTRTQPVSTQAGRRWMTRPIRPTTGEYTQLQLDALSEEERAVYRLKQEVDEDKRKIEELLDRILLYKVLLAIVSALLIYKWFF